MGAFSNSLSEISKKEITTEIAGVIELRDIEFKEGKEYADEIIRKVNVKVLTNER